MIMYIPGVINIQVKQIISESGGEAGKGVARCAAQEAPERRCSSSCLSIVWYEGRLIG